MRAVSNSGPLIHLSWVDLLNLLPQLFREVIVPEAVQREVLRAGTHVSGVPALRAAFDEGWLRVNAPSSLDATQEMRSGLDRGEAEAIALMRNAQADILLLDDGQARRHTRAMGIPIVGTVGILRESRQRGLLSEVMPILEGLRHRGFRIGDAILDEIGREEAPGAR